MTRQRISFSVFLMCLFGVLFTISGCGGGGHHDTTPPEVTLTSITVSPATATFVLGTNQVFTAKGVYSDESTKDITATAQWSAVDATIAWLNNSTTRKGTATARGAGSTTVKATLSGVTGTASARVTALTPRFAYLTNYPDGTLSTFILDPVSGSMRAKDYTYLNGADPMQTVMHPAGKFLYFIDHTTGSVGAYVVDTESGELSPISGSPFKSGLDPWTLVINPSGKFLYVGSQLGTVTAFGINAGTGALTQLTGSPFSAGSRAMALATEPAGKFLYVADRYSNTVVAFSIGADGTLTKITGSPFATGGGPSALRVDATGQYLYVADYSDKTISAFAINASTGALTPVSGSPFVGGLIESFAFDPGGQYLYGADQDQASPSDFSGSVRAYAVNADTGALTPLGVSSTVGKFPTDLTVDPSGKLLYVVNNGSRDLWTFGISHQTGALTLLQTTRSRRGFSIALAAGQSAASVKPRFAYAVGPANGAVGAYTVNASTGELTEIQGSPVATAGASISVAAHPSGNFVYVANYWAYKVSAYKVDANSGALSEISGSPYAFPSVNSGPYMVQVEPSGRFLYMTNGYDVLAGMAINPSTGALSAASWQPAKIFEDVPWGPSGFAIDPTGRFLYVADSSMVSISEFEIDQEDGSPHEVTGSPLKMGPLGSYPQALVIDPTGKFLYMPLRCPSWSTSCATNALRGFSIDADDGHLVEMGSSPWETPFTDIVSLAMDAGGRFLYAVDGGGANIQTAKGTHGFAVDPMTGKPTPLTNGFPFQPPAITFLNAAPTGAFIYGGNISTDQIETYAIDPANGALTNKQALKFTAGGAPWSIAVTQTIQ